MAKHHHHRFDRRRLSPTHPGAILREDVLPSLPGMPVSAFARNLGESPQTDFLS